jgi:hypothetical protein
MFLLEKYSNFYIIRSLLLFFKRAGEDQENVISYSSGYVSHFSEMLWWEESMTFFNGTCLPGKKTFPE